MKRIFIYAGIILSVVMTACSVKKTYSYSEYRIEQPTQSVYAVPVVADLEVAQERISYSERLGVKVSDLSDSELQSLVEKEKSLVMNNAMKAHSADVLVAPLVDIQTDMNNQLIITVSAYPAKYKNYRSATKEDEWFINVPLVEIK